MAVLSYLDAPPTTHIPMTKEQSDMFIKCFFADQTGKVKGENFNQGIAEQCGALGQILFYRLDIAKVEMSVGLALFLMHMSGGSPGELVMWAYTMNRIYDKRRKVLTMDVLSEFFPWGFPNEKERHRLWDAQKVHQHGEEFRGGTDNMVDRADTWVLSTGEKPDVTVGNGTP
jgi:hypothetical protein